MKINISFGGQRWQCPMCKGKYQRVRHTDNYDEKQVRIAKCRWCGFKAEITTGLVPVTNLETKIIAIKEAK